jgi:lipid-A-disaccharide synthase-like uncharacterized protein
VVLDAWSLFGNGLRYALVFTSVEFLVQWLMLSLGNKHIKPSLFMFMKCTVVVLISSTCLSGVFDGNNLVLGLD